MSRVWRVSKDTKLPDPPEDTELTTQTELKGTVASVQFEESWFRMRLSSKSKTIKVTGLTDVMKTTLLRALSQDASHLIWVTGSAKVDLATHRYTSLRATDLKPVQRLDEAFFDQFAKLFGPITNTDEHFPQNPEATS